MLVVNGFQYHTHGFFVQLVLRVKMKQNMGSSVDSHAFTVHFKYSEK